MKSMRYLQPGDLVAVRWTPRAPWERGTVVCASPTLLTAMCGDVEYRDIPLAPEHVRPLRLAYCRDRSARGAA